MIGRFFINYVHCVSLQTTIFPHYDSMNTLKLCILDNDHHPHIQASTYDSRARCQQISLEDVVCGRGAICVNYFFVHGPGFDQLIPSIYS
jgi:hypothetical protein